MDDPIISRDLIRAKGAQAYRDGKGRDAHGMNPGAAAIETWQQGWDQQHALWTQKRKEAASCL